MPKQIDDVYIQRRVITYVACHLGTEVEHTMKGSKTRTRLNSVLIEARAAVCPKKDDNSDRGSKCEKDKNVISLDVIVRVVDDDTKKKKKKKTTTLKCELPDCV